MTFLLRSPFDELSHSSNSSLSSLARFKLARFEDKNREPRAARAAARAFEGASSWTERGAGCGGAGDDEGRGGGKTAKWTRLAVEAAAVTSGAESSMSPSGSKEDRRVQTTFPHLSTPGRPDRDFDAERRSADERREHRRMAEGFGNIQKIVDEGGETQIAAGERRAKGLALRGKVRSSGRFGKHTPAAMYEHAHGPVSYHSSYPEEITAVNYRRR